MDRTTIKILLAMVFAVLLYLLSPPYLLYVSWRMNSVGMDEVLNHFYAPAEWLADHCPPYHHLIKFLMRHGPRSWE